MTAIPTRGLSAGIILMALALLPLFSAGAAAADLISGAVRNQTQGGRAAAGDDVVLIRLDQGMQEEARIKTDAQGAFALKVHDPGKLYVVRVVHQGVNYDLQSSAGDSLSIDVFDASAKVSGVTGSIEILRAGTNGNLLHVSDLIEIKNNSSPPLTQAGDRTFEVYLPAHAKIGSVMAAGPGKISVIIAAFPVPGEPGHYTVNFPLRPGSTKFAFNYDVPYDGHAAFRPRLVHPLRQLAVMIPPSMKFTSQSRAFQLLPTGNSDYQVQAANHLKAGEGPAFEITGTGAVPPLQARSQSQAGTQAATLPGSALQSPAIPSAGMTGAQAPATSGVKGSTPAPVATGVSAFEWRLLAVAAVLVLGACGFLIWRARRRSSLRLETQTKSATAKARPAAASTTSLLEALKEELLELETNRLKGSISREEYDAAKRALDGTVKRALMRAATGQ
jgi:hypothetical protein